MPAAAWAKRRTGAKDTDAASPASVEPAASSATTGAPSVSAASDEGFQDDKFHLPVEHRAFMLLPGWDRPPAPPPTVDTGSESESGSGSEDEGDDEPSESSGGSEEDDDEEGAGGAPGQPGQPDQQQLAPPPPQGFSCATCAHFKAHGNGMFGCDEPNFQRWSGTDKLVETKSGKPVLNPQMACSDWYEPAAHHGGKPVTTRHNGLQESGSSSASTVDQPNVSKR